MLLEHGFDCKNKEYQKIEVGKAKNYINHKFNRLTVLFRVNILNHNYGKQVFWLCQCDCGNIIAIASNKLTRSNNATQSCGCMHNEIIHQLGVRSRKDFTGQVINGITFLKFNSTYKQQNNIHSKNAYWDCKCHCGKIFTANSSEIVRNRILSCGCLGTRQSLGEQIIERILKEHNVKYVYDTPYFSDLYLNNNALGRYDFILFNDQDQPYRIIEFDGLQHYKNTSFFYTSEQEFRDRQEKDTIKNQYALNHNIPLIRIPYNQLKNLSWELLMSDTFLIS